MVADLNGDGNLDLAVANLGDGTLSILLGDGTGNFTLTSSPNVNGYPYTVAVGDFNGDGILDLATANGNYNTLSILLGDGKGDFTLTSSPPTGSEPTSLVVGDFNGDGRLDVVAMNESSNTASVLLQAPAVTLSPNPLSFGNQPVGTPSTSSVMVTNTGSANLNVTPAPTITGTNSGDFQIQNEDCVSSSPIAPNGTCTISVTFTPSLVGSEESATLTVTDDSGDIPGSQQTVNLTGTGIQDTTTTKITGIAPNPSMVGQSVTVSYSVTVNAPGSGTIPGTETVTVTDSTGASCKGTVAAGSCALVPAAVGPDTITATYGGDSNFGTSTTSVSASFSIVPSLNLTGLQSTTTPQQSTSVGVALNAATTTQLTGTLTLSFQSNAAGTPAGYIDPMTCFVNSTSQCVTQIGFTIPVGASVANLPNNGAIQQGTTAGTITVTLTNLVAGTTTVVLPQPTPSKSVTVQPSAPGITSGTIANLTSTGFDVVLTAYSTPHDLASVTCTFQAAGGATLSSTAPSTISLSSTTSSWFSGTGLQYGGSFQLTVPFTFSGDTSGLGSAIVTLNNSVGTSSSYTVTF